MGIVICGTELEDKGDGRFKMGKNDFYEALDSLGVTKEVRTAVDRAEGEIAKQALSQARDELVKNPELDAVVVECGTRTDGLTVALPIRSESSGTTKNGDDYHSIKYGNASVKRTRRCPSAVKEIMDEIAEDCEAAWNRRSMKTASSKQSGIVAA